MVPGGQDCDSDKSEKIEDEADSNKNLKIPKIQPPPNHQAGFLVPSPAFPLFSDELKAIQKKTDTGGWLLYLWPYQLILVTSSALAQTNFSFG